MASDAEIVALCTAWNEITPFRMGRTECDWPACKCHIAPKLTDHVLARLREAQANLPK